ncbi:Protein kinase superfamily protein with octicosapeptide/Phox/Bem1p domain [Striga hermonthica]|uniref:Protein kinase superfamily protein with octicosapeptide/Phox/Bem1p domain n=1 Tax=Striga hermonthica TaxID=68872 RepID=A0A9N7MYE0_STRHE|nr:Protein kinase superfamily protein with octicosapeptide/Phox/Bem1p domain [Striga hermonthica]
MEQPNNHDLAHFNSSEHRTVDNGPDSQVFMADSSGHANVSAKPPEITFSEAKPVLNYSIQTGEEFSLEFMRDRFNPRKLLPETYSDTSQAPGYLQLKGILGIGHTGSESGSDISMIAPVAKESKELSQKNPSANGDIVNNNHGSLHSMQAFPCAPLIHTSSGASDSSSTKLKILCSFGGKILPRPSDGKLRYVGGETRIIRINRDITWKELWQKTKAIYEETCAVKYQLPGEDLDALVTISSDEDILNMMEECNVLQDGEWLRKLRMFLFSPEDLDETNFSLTNGDNNSDLKYVVAVNGIGFGSRKGSGLHGPVSSSGNNLDKLDTQNIFKREMSRADDLQLAGGGSSNLAGFLVPPIAAGPSPPTMPISSGVYGANLRYYDGHSVQYEQQRQQPPQFDYNLHSPYYAPTDINLPQSSQVPVPEQNGLEGMSLDTSGTLDKDVKEKDATLEANGLIKSESENQQIFVNEQFVPSLAHSDSAPASLPVEEPSCMVSKLERELSSKNLNGKGRPEEPLLVPKSLDAVPPSSSGNGYVPLGNNAPVPAPTNSESDPTDLSYFGSSFPPQRVFRSVWIPREQGESLSRISKSDDTHSSQFLVNQSNNDDSQKALFAVSVDKPQNVHLNIPTEQQHSTEGAIPQEPESVIIGLSKNQKLKQMNPVEAIDILKAETEPVLKLPDVSLENIVKDSEDSTIRWVEGATQAINNDAQPSTWSENHEESSVGVPVAKQGDILIDINDRFPRDLLSEIFTKAILSDSSSDFGVLQKDGPGLSVNIENHDPKHWSFFQRLAGDEFTRRDVSLIDQDQIVFPSGLTEVKEEAPLAYDFVPQATDGILPDHRGVQEKFREDYQKEMLASDGAVSSVHLDYDSSLVQVSEAMKYDDLMENTRNRDSGYEDGFGNIDLPSLDRSLVDIDLTSLQIIKNADLEELRELGSGTFGTVYHGKWRGSDVAIKRIKKSCFTGRQSEQERQTMEFWREAEILSKLHHPNVVALYGVVQDSPGNTLATVTEYMVDGSLRHVLLRKDRHLDRRKRLIIAMDAAFGMEYLHSKNIVHFDLKCDNLLVNLKDPSRPICKVGDFGLSKIKRNTLVSGGVRGTLPWMAPELLNGSSNKVSEKVDVFSFGIVLWEILTGEEPYASMHYGAIIGGIVNNTLRPKIPSYCDAEWRALMEQCWAPNPALRPSFTEIAGRLRVMSAPAQIKKSAT